MNAEEKQAIRERYEEAWVYRGEQSVFESLPDIPRLLDALDAAEREVERLRDIGKDFLEDYHEQLRENQRLRKEITELMAEIHEQLDYERWAESKGYGYDEYFKAIDNGEWDNVGDQALAGEEKG